MPISVDKRIQTSIYDKVACNRGLTLLVARGEITVDADEWRSVRNRLRQLAGIACNVRKHYPK
jgi:hypothetical protein